MIELYPLTTAFISLTTKQANWFPPEKTKFFWINIHFLHLILGEKKQTPNNLQCQWSLQPVGTLTTKSAILIPWPGTEPMRPAVEAQSPIRWTAKEFPVGILKTQILYENRFRSEEHLPITSDL